MVIGLPAIMEDLRIPINIGMWTISAFYIMSTLYLLPAGRWSDMLGTKRIFLCGLTLFTISTALCGLAYSGATLIGARLLQGTGAAMAMASATPILIRTFPPIRWRESTRCWHSFLAKMPSHTQGHFFLLRFFCYFLT
ncbi:MFS transporter [Brevibacillus porteri]|uniref:MFS transporter n=1 Tax=Brevibacillus porteri TaxID=2126350 RepID=UPI00363D5464